MDTLHCFGRCFGMFNREFSIIVEIRLAA